MCSMPLSTLGKALISSHPQGCEPGSGPLEELATALHVADPEASLNLCLCLHGAGHGECVGLRLPEALGTPTAPLGNSAAHTCSQPLQDSAETIRERQRPDIFIKAHIKSGSCGKLTCKTS
jgi:hypothetical protein